MTFLYHADSERGMEWAALFAERAPDIAFSFQPHEINPADVRISAYGILLLIS
jgi:glyoxylate/hydroxypyruvate reductase